MKSVTLSRPIENGNTRISEITIDEPTVGAIEAFENAKAAGKADTTAMLEMLAMDTSIPIDVLRKLRASDLKKISDAFGPFLLAATNGEAGEP